MIQAYTINSQYTEAIQLYKEMTKQEIIPDEFAYSLIIKVFAEVNLLGEGIRVHKQLKVT